MNSASKGQIDRLGERLRDGPVSENDLRELDAYRESFSDAYGEIIARIRTSTGLEPTGRPMKTPFSIVQKLRREKGMQLSRMQDIAGCRLVVASMPEQDCAVRDLTQAFVKVRVLDRREKPSHGYRAVHIIVSSQGKAVEIQVRTELQNLWAQLSEVMSDVFDPAIKYGGGDLNFQRGLLLTSDQIGNLEKVEKFFEDIEPGLAKKLLSEEVIAVSPREISPELMREILKRRLPGKKGTEVRLDELSTELAKEFRRHKSSETSMHHQLQEMIRESAETKARLLEYMKSLIERFGALSRKVN